MKRINKKGLSPIVATTLLISIVVVLAAIIFIWARTFFGEQITKFGEPIKESCKNADFEASYSGGELTITNHGNVPIYGIEIVEKGIFGTSKLGEYSGMQYAVLAGELKGFNVGEVNDENVDDIVIVPILLGSVGEGEETKAFLCDADYSISLI